MSKPIIAIESEMETLQRDLANVSKVLVGVVRQTKKLKLSADTHKKLVAVKATIDELYKQIQ
jgi:hypothetical protein